MLVLLRYVVETPTISSSIILCQGEKTLTVLMSVTLEKEIKHNEIYN